MLMEQIREVDGLASLTRELENSMKKRKYDENLKDQMNPAAPIHMMSPYYDQSQVYQSYYPSPTPYGYDLGNSMYQQLIYQQMQQYPQYPVMMNPENVKFMQNGMQNIEDIPKKRKRTNYKDPENAAKLNNALNCMMNQNGDDTPKDLKTVSKMFGVPYNTLRDNYLRVTTGQVPTRAKPKNNDDVDKKKSLSPSNKNPSPRTSTGGNSVPSSLGAAQYPVCFPAMVPLPIMPAFPQYAAPVASYPMQMISMVPQGQKPGGYPFYQNKEGHYPEPKSSPLLSAKSSGSQNSQSRGSISKNKSKESDDGAASPFASDVSRTPSVDHTSHSENSNDDV